MKLTTYLNYGGTCEEAFKFYEQHLGGRITSLMRHGGMPGEAPPHPEWANKVLHARLALGGTELLGADVDPGRFQPMRSAYLTLMLTGSEGEKGPAGRRPSFVAAVALLNAGRGMKR